MPTIFERKGNVREREGEASTLVSGDKEKMYRLIMVRARYEKGVLKPLERLDLEEGKELVVILKIRRDKGERGLKKFYGIIKGVDLDVYEEEYYEYLSERAGFSR